jgi:hypothetical protein
VNEYRFSFSRPNNAHVERCFGEKPAREVSKGAKEKERIYFEFVARSKVEGGAPAVLVEVSHEIVVEVGQVLMLLLSEF